MRVIAFVIAALSAYGGSLAFAANAYGQGVFSLVALVGAMALYSSHPKSRYFVYTASAAISIAWILSVLYVALTGWPSYDLLQSIISLIPGLLLLTACVGCSIHAARHFRHSSGA